MPHMCARGNGYFQLLFTIFRAFVLLASFLTKEVLWLFIHSLCGAQQSRRPTWEDSHSGTQPTHPSLSKDCCCHSILRAHNLVGPPVPLLPGYSWQLCKVPPCEFWVAKLKNASSCQTFIQSALATSTLRMSLREHHKAQDRNESAHETQEDTELAHQSLQWSTQEKHPLHDSGVSLQD